MAYSLQLVLFIETKKARFVFIYHFYPIFGLFWKKHQLFGLFIMFYRNSIYFQLLNCVLKFFYVIWWRRLKKMLNNWFWIFFFGYHSTLILILANRIKLLNTWRSESLPNRKVHFSHGSVIDCWYTYTAIILLCHHW